MKTGTVRLSQTARCPAGHALCMSPRCYLGQVEGHSFRARIEDGGLVVTDKSGNRVPIRCAGTTDNRTVYAYVEGTGFIGGWQYPHRAMPWAYLAESINQGIVYAKMADLPRRSPKTRKEG